MAFLGMPNMETYQSKDTKYRGGEHYVSASMDWALRQLDFEVDVISKPRQTWGVHWSQTISESYHRVFTNGQYVEGCKARMFQYFPGKASKQQDVYHPKQILKSYPNSHHTFVGYFLHHLVANLSSSSWNGEYSRHYPLEEPQPSLSITKRRAGLLLGKEPGQFEGENTTLIIQTLLKRGFTLHSTCNKCNTTTLPRGVMNHKLLTPSEFDVLLQNCSFVIGFGQPKWSPTPLVAIGKGTAFLNPLEKVSRRQRRGRKNDSNQQIGVISKHPQDSFLTQNNAVSLMGKPYVYNYRIGNVRDALEAAEEAYQTPFQPYTPYEFRPEAMIARMCSILEDDSICAFQQNFTANINATVEIRAYGI